MFKQRIYQKVWLTCLSLLSFVLILGVPIHAQTDATSSASSSVTASSASSIKQTSSSAATTTSKAITNATIVVKYVNQNNQPIAAEKVLSGKVGTKYNATNLKKTIKGYRLKTTQNVIGQYSVNHAAIVFTYHGVKVKLTIHDIDDWKNNLDEEQGIKRSVTGYYGDTYKIKPLKSDGETLISSPSILTGQYPLKNKIITLRYTQTMNDVVFSSDKSVTVSEIILGRLTDVIQTYPNGEKIAVIVNNNGVYRVGTSKSKYTIVAFKQLKTLKRNETVQVVSTRKTQTQTSVLPDGYIRIQRIVKGRNYQTDGSLTSPSGHITSVLTTVKDGVKSDVSEEGPGIPPTQVAQTWPNGDILTTLTINKNKLQVTLQNKTKDVLSTRIITKAPNSGYIFKLSQNQYLVYQVGAQKKITTTLITGNQYKRQSFTVHGAVKINQGKLSLNQVAKQALKNGDLKAFVAATSTSKTKKSVNPKQLVNKPKAVKKSTSRKLPATGESQITPLAGIVLFLISGSIYIKYKKMM